MASKFLLVGSGAREHAIAQALCRRKDVRLYAFMSTHNPGIKALCESSKGAWTVGDIHSPPAVADWAKRMDVELAFPSPDAVLAAGVSDELTKVGIRICAPLKSAARIEWDKAYLRHLMGKYRVAGAPVSGYFKTPQEVDGFIDSLGGQVAVKPIGLTGGKGVQVVGLQLKDGADAKRYARSVMEQKIGGDWGVLIEQKLVGEEFTLQAFCDGRELAPMPAVQDHKRAHPGDAGPNTGGMGSYSTGGPRLPFITQDDYDAAFKILQKVARALTMEGSIRYQGVMYGQFMATSSGVMLVEINARFGDPEAMNVLALLKTPLADVFEAISEGHLKSLEVDWLPQATVVKYLVPDGYPGKSVPPAPLKVDEKKLKASGAQLFYASVDQRPDALYSASSRAIAVLGVGKDLAEAEKKAEAGCKAVSGPLWHRSDIGTKALVAQRVEHMKKLGRRF